MYNRVAAAPASLSYKSVDQVSQADPLRDDPATTLSEINEHGDGVRWSFVLRRTVLRLRSLAAEGRRSFEGRIGA